MAVFQNFSVDKDKTYTLVNSASAFGSGKGVKLPSEGQFFAIAFNRSTREFEPVYFTEYKDAAATSTGSIQTGGKIQGTFNGSDIFIVQHANKELGLLPNLLAELTVWREKFTTGFNPLVKKRDISFGQISKGMETVFPTYAEELKAAEVARKAALAERKAAAEATPPPPETPPAQEIRDAAAEVAREPAQPAQTQLPRTERDPRSLPPIAEPTGDDEYDDLPREVRNFEGIIFRGTVARIRDEKAEFRHIKPEYPIPELREGDSDKDAFAHFNQVPGAARFREGEEVEFELEIAPNGRIQVKSAWYRGEARPDLDRRNEHRDYDADQDPNEPPQFDSRDRRILKGPIRTDFATGLPHGGVIAGGAWKPVRSRDRDPA